ncbi:DUF2163 domain-containing protein [Mycoplana sp. BE70]|uniref:baseplate hub domain-containing protein n=1 Tax=Mycoplana sp. BE70 TaxID=2817775 RepID=UPI00286C85BF|nr:DUF2163 domain-containing protein [Mycoplana sp. BE70]
MRRIPSELADHLAGDATTVCQCWRVTRRDGTVLGFTEHDRDLVFAGLTYRARKRFSGERRRNGRGTGSRGKRDCRRLLVRRNQRGGTRRRTL